MRFSNLRWWNNPRTITWLNRLVVAGLLLAPYYLFGLTMFLGGDDSRLYMAYPLMFAQHIAGSSWLQFSTVGLQASPQFLLPLLGVLSALDLVLPKVVVNHLALSFPAILGFLFFQKMMAELVRDAARYRVELLVGGLLYILSPILAVVHWSNFLYAAWLVGVIPLVTYYYIRYLKTGRFAYVWYTIIWCFFLALAFFAVPWLFGFLIPAAIGLAAVLTKIGRPLIRRLARRTAAFFGLLALSQSFWLLPFIDSFRHVGGYGVQILSSDTAQTFEPVVAATARGDIWYPLLGLFHRQLTFDFNWDLRHVFTNFYDHTLWLNLLLVGIMAAGLWYRRVLGPAERRLYLGTGIAFMVALLLFTVNVGFFKQVFIWLGHVPGFAAFRNAFDKFALGYVLLYAAFLTLSLIIVGRRVGPKLRLLMLAAVMVVVLINAIPFKQIITKPLWTTEHVGTNLTLPNEYQDFMKEVKRRVPDTSTILSLPFGITSYSLVKADHAEAVYAGRSPVQVLTGINDFSGLGSFSPEDAKLVRKMLEQRDYATFRNFLLAHNVGYVLETTNLPPEALKSYLFDKDLLASQDAGFRDNLYGQPIATSSRGAYHLYAIQSPNAPTPRTITTPSVVYGLSQSSLLTDEPTRQALFGLIDREHVRIDGFQQAAYRSDLYSVRPGEGTSLRQGRYQLFENASESYSLRYNPDAQTISLETPAFSIGNQDIRRTINQTLAAVTDPNTVVLIKNRPYRLNQLDNVRVGSHDTIELYRPKSDNLLPAADVIYRTWQRVDCYAYDARSLVEYGVIFRNSDELALLGSEHHNACIHNSIPVRQNNLYEVSFEYRTDSEKLDFQLYLDNQQSIQLTLPTALDDWQPVSQFFTTHDNHVAQPYFYSGQSITDSTSVYRKIRLREYEAFRSVAIADVLTSPDQGPLLIDANQGDQFVLHSDSRPVVAGQLPLRQWHRGDCKAIDQKPAVFFVELAEFQGIELRSTDNHRACINNDFQILPGAVYRLDFDYSTPSAPGLTAYVSYKDQAQSDKLDLPAGNDEWRHFSQTITPPAGASVMQTYLYSGNGTAKEATARYRNLTLTALSASNKDVLIRQPERPLQPPRHVETKKLSNHAYQFRLSGITGDFLIRFLDSYHEGWRLYARHWYPTVFARPIDVPHYRTNSNNNAWWIDVDQVCRQQHRCSRNADGTYDLQLVLYFGPQRVFYLGEAITLVTLLTAFLLWRRRRSQPDAKSRRTR